MTKRIIGTGKQVYEVIYPFAKLPSGMSFGNVSNVACDSNSRVYAYQRKDPPILIFDGDGNLLETWGDGLLVDAHGIFVDDRDDLFLIDRDAHEVLKFDPHGKILLRIGNRESPSLQTPFNHPADVAVSSEGDILVADGYGNSVVHRFTSEGKFVASWGGAGEQPGQFTTPHGIWVDRRDRVYVADRENNCIQIFTLDGELINVWQDLFHPMDIFIDQKDNLFVTDQTPRLSVFNLNGELINRGRSPEAGHGIYGDPLGNLYLAGAFRGIVKLELIS